MDGRIFQNEQNKKRLLEVTHNNLLLLDMEEVDIEFVPFNKFRAARGAAALAIKKFVLQEGR